MSILIKNSASKCLLNACICNWISFKSLKEAVDKLFQHTTIPKGILRPIHIFFAPFANHSIRMLIVSSMNCGILHTPSGRSGRAIQESKTIIIKLLVNLACTQNSFKSLQEAVKSYFSILPYQKGSRIAFKIVLHLWLTTQQVFCL